MGNSVHAGMRVVRGPDWKWQEQDKGEGQVGTVVGMRLGGKDVLVMWDFGVQANYRANLGDGKCDLRLLDNAALGVNHPGVRCQGCQEMPILGMRWKCSDCPNVNLCSKCYNGDIHNLNHVFLRFETDTCSGVKVPKREGSEKVPMNGIFEGAKVVRGKDWQWGNQDKVRHPNISCGQCSENPIIGTRWRCRTCADFDLCTDCYKAMAHDQHRGFLKIPAPSAEPIVAEPRDPAVMIEGKLDEMLGALFGGRVTRSRPDEEATAAPGQVTKLTGWDGPGRGAVEVKWPGGQTNKYRLGHQGKVDLKYTSCTTGGYYYKNSLPVLGREDEVEIMPSEITEGVPKAAAAVPSPPKFKEDDMVLIDVDVEKFKVKQDGHGGWNPAMAKLVGRVGKVTGYDTIGNVRVQFEERTFSINPDVCKLASHKEGPAQHSATSPHSATSQQSASGVEGSGATGKAMVAVEDTKLSDGDTVRVNMNIDSLKAAQIGKAGWVPAMAEVVGKVGKITMITGPIAMVTYEGIRQPLPFSPTVLTKVTPAMPGDQVQISNDLNMVSELLKDDGEWTPRMVSVLGKKVTIQKVLGDNKLLVQAGSRTWPLNARVCTLVARAPKEQKKPDGASSTSDLEKKVEDMESVINCTICCEKKRSVAFGCGHTSCQPCSQKLIVCHICRAFITQRVNFFI